MTGKTSWRDRRVALLGQLGRRSRDERSIYQKYEQTLMDLVPEDVRLAPVLVGWQEHWRGMPEFVQERAVRWATVDVRFRTDGDYRAFRRKIAAYGHFSGKASKRVKPFMLFSNFEVYKRERRIWVDGGAPVLPRYPIYVVSKGRAGKQLTSRALQHMHVPHFVVVERQELEKYARHKMPLATLLALDPQYQQDYDAFDDLGMTKSKGPGPARNFAWAHAIANGHAWHWVMDDNIQSFYRLGHNRKFLVKCGAIFRAMETFCERYENVSMAGPHYEMFAPSRQAHPAFITNTRVYSCNLIRNDIPYRWRGRYNEDTDLSLRILKDGNCTVQFFAFLQNKLGTQRLKGGNTAAFYEDKAGDASVFEDEKGWVGVDVSKMTQGGTAPKSQMLYAMHPDVTRLILRWGRPHHLVDYAPFAHNALQLKPSVALPDGPDELGMVQKQYVRSRKTSAAVSTNRNRRQTTVSRDQRLGKDKAIRVHFEGQDAMDKFAEITGLRVTRDIGEATYPPEIEKAGVGLLARRDS